MIQHTVELPVPVEIDADSGEWSVDGFAMILVPRHYWAGIMEAVESHMGVVQAAKLYFDATYAAAFTWCRGEAKTHDLEGAQIFHHYLRRMSERGWGKFTVATLDIDTGTGTVTLEHSAIARARSDAGRAVCHSFNGAFCGALDALRIAGEPGQSVSHEVQCMAEGAPHCQFEISNR